MYFIWILIGIPIASLLCAALVVIRDGKVRSANEPVHRTGSACSITALSKTDKVDDWNSENSVQVLIGILNNPNSDGFRVTIRQAAAQKVLNGGAISACYTSEVWIARGKVIGHLAYRWTRTWPMTVTVIKSHAS
jgi:hypothetical protein